MATPKPNTNPISTLMRSQLISCPELRRLSVDAGGGTGNPGLSSAVKGGPHKPLLPAKEAFGKVEN
ncbi:unnamed protein product [Prunus armeniaca]